MQQCCFDFPFSCFYFSLVEMFMSDQRRRSSCCATPRMANATIIIYNSWSQVLSMFWFPFELLFFFLFRGDVYGWPTLNLIKSLCTLLRTANAINSMWLTEYVALLDRSIVWLTRGSPNWESTQHLSKQTLFCALQNVSIYASGRIFVFDIYLTV